MPVLAAIVPVMGGVLLFVLTGSPFALWFCALAPVMAAATYIDAGFAARRARRRDDAHRRRTLTHARAELAALRDAERASRWAAEPDLLRLTTDRAEPWRPVPARVETLVVGRGTVAAGIRLTGDDRAVSVLRAEAETLDDAPLAVPMTAGIAVVGPSVLAEAVARALQVQVLCRLAPGAVFADGLDERWAAAVPHTPPAPRRLVAAPPSAPGDIGVVALPPGVPPPPGCAAVLTLTGPDTAHLDHDGRIVPLCVEAVSTAQARAVVAALAERARTASPATRFPAGVRFGDLPAATGGLAVHLGATADGPFRLDLVADGPHAVVAGITGAGKSELLTSWITGMAAGRGVEEVTFLLADFKGGTAFDRLAGLPHVTGVVTDLDDRGARRAIESLRAEIRHREAVLAAGGVRDVGDPAAGLPRLVIVVDEFAALLQAAPELGAVFTDVAARGRALGMHLILGTQRASGVVRDALLANCPLRVSLRVTDAADSRFLLGGDDAAVEPEHGVAHIRVADAARATRVRIALTGDHDIAAVARAAAGGAPPRAPWLPPLPDRLPADGVPASPDGFVLGIADEPARQRQGPLLLRHGDGGLAVIGGPGSGRSGLLRALAAQDPGALVLPADPEAAWDLLAAEDPAAPGSLLVCDDLDVLLTRFPPDHAAAVADRITTMVRAGGRCPVIAVGRIGGPAARLVDLCGRRAVLRLPSRLDHVSAGAEVATHDPHAPRGRGTVDGTAVQFLDAPGAPPAVAPVVERWRPVPGVSGLVLSGGGRARGIRDALHALGATVTAPGEAGSADGPVRVVVGDVDQWQRSWQELAAVRAHGELVVDAACGGDYRLLTGDRALPPYCAPGRGRAWLLDGAGRPRRVLLPGADAGGAAGRVRW
ncbi:FtsK/SpoIIIE domain-containing protein [Microbacterium sp. GXF7504]